MTDRKKKINIVIPMAGLGKKFQEAGYTFPKPLIDIGGKTMIEIVVNNMRPKEDHAFIFICQKEHYDKYNLYNIFKNITKNNFEVITIAGSTQGAACTALCAIEHINSDEELIIANSDQFIEFDINELLQTARKTHDDGLILTFPASHPKWSYARTDASGRVIETAEKKVISPNATAGVYYFKHGKDFVSAAQSMIYKGIHHENEYYICPVYNELIIKGEQVRIYPISAEKVHGMGTPEDFENFKHKVEDGKLHL